MSSTDRNAIIQELMRHIEGLSFTQASTIAQFTHERIFKGGDMVFEEGDTARNLYLVLKGAVFLCFTLPELVATVNLALIGPSEFFGWSAVVPPHRKSAAARVVKTTRTLIIDAEKLLVLCDQDQSIGYLVMWRLLGTVSGRLKTTRQQIISLFIPKGNDLELIPGLG